MAQVGSSVVLTWLRNIRELYNTIPTALYKIQGNKNLKMDKWQNKEEEFRRRWILFEDKKDFPTKSNFQPV